MFKRAQYLAISVLAVSLSGGAIAGEGMQGHEDNAATFSKLDADNNGMLSTQEARAKAAEVKGTDQLTTKWTELDTNQDGQLDQSEFARFEPVDSPATDRMDSTTDHTDMDSAEPEDKMHNYGEDQNQQ